MRQIDTISNDPRQITYLVIPGYETARFDLEYKPNQYSWFFTLQWQDVYISNQRLVTSPNILSQYSKFIPFGIFCDSSNGNDPLTVTAFQDYCKLYLLTSAEVLTVEQVFYG